MRFNWDIIGWNVLTDEISNEWSVNTNQIVNRKSVWYAITELKNGFRINNTDLIFEKLIYVNPNGLDTNLGTKESPFKTIRKAFDYLYDNGYLLTSAILLSEGTHDAKSLFNGSSYNINSKFNQMMVSIIVEKPGNTLIINSGEWGLVENNSSYRIQVKFYQIIFRTTYGHAFHLSMDDWPNEYYNCVFDLGTGGWNGRVFNTSTYVYNSLFTKNASTDGSRYNAPIYGNAQNSASAVSDMDPYAGEIKTSLYNVTFSSDYKITSSGWENAGTGLNPDGSRTHIGVYGGPFAWS